MRKVKQGLALLLTLLMLVSCLPMAVFAAGADYSVSYRIERTSNATYNGQDVAEFSFVVSAQDKTVGNGNGITVAYDTAVFELLNYELEKQSVSRENGAFSQNIGTDVYVSIYEADRKAFDPMAYACLSDDGKWGYMALQPTLSAKQVTISGDVVLMSVYFGLAEGASWDAIPTNAIRLVTSDERDILNQDTIVVVNDGYTTSYIYGSVSGDDTLAEPKMETVGYTPVLAAYTGTEAVAPTVFKKQGGNVTLNTQTVDGETVEYAYGTTATTPTSGWQDSTGFTGLEAGEYYFFARVKETTDHKAGEAVASEAVTIYAAPTISYADDALADLKVGQSVSASPTTVQGDALPLTYSAEGLPDGLSIDTRTGMISGAPITTTAEGGTATVTVTDSEGQTGTATVTWGKVSGQSLSAANFTYTDITETYDAQPVEAAVTYAGEITTEEAGTLTVYYEGTGETTYDKTTDAPTDAGTYSVIAQTAGGNKYEPSEVTVGTLTIGKKPVSVLNIEIQTKPYDGTVKATVGTISFNVGAGENPIAGDDANISLFNIKAEFDNASAGENKTVTITGGLELTGTKADNYELRPFEKTLTGTITPAEYQDNSTAEQNVVVGVGDFTQPTFTGVDGETVDGRLTYTYGGSPKTYDEIKAALAALSEGETATISWNFTAKTGGNYVTEPKTGTINVTMVDIQITWPVVTIKDDPTYGDTWAEIVTFTGGSASLNGKNVPGTFTLVNTGMPNAGSGLTYSLNFKSTDGKYNVTSAAAGNITVAPKAITVTVEPASRPYGAANPAFDFTVPADALEGQDTKEGLGVTLTTEATEASNVGSYAVTKAGQSTTNYTVTVADNTALTVTKADITGVSDPAAWTAIPANDSKNDTAEALLAAVADGRTTLDAAYANGATTVTAQWKLTGGTWSRTGGEYTYTATLTPTDTTNFNATTITKTLDVTVTPVTGTISWNVTALTKAKSEIDSANSITDVLGVGTVAVTYDNAVSDGPYTITGSTPALETLKDYNVSAGDQVVEVVPTVVFPAWATISNADDLKTTLTITEKYPVTVSFTAQPTDITYGGSLTAPVATQEPINNGIDEGALFTYTYTGTTAGGEKYESTDAPTDAGTYTVTAVLNSQTHSGQKSANFTIAQKEVTLTWANVTGLIYDGTAKQVTATAGELADGDVCTVTVTGGSETNAGDYTATATALSNANYKLPEVATQAYSIAKADRNLTVTPATLLLYPGSLTGQITASTSTDLDKSAVITYTSGSTSTVTVNSSGKVTAVANSKATVTVAIAETANYNAATSQTVTVTALPQPLTGVSVSSTTNTDKLTAEVADGKIVVSGAKTAGSTLTFTPATAAVEGVTIDSVVTENTLTLKVGETVIATYAIDTANVTELDANVTLEDESKTSGNEVTGDKATAASDAVSAAETKTDGLVESAAKTLNDAAKALAESKKSEIEAAFGEGATYTIKVEPSVTFTAKALDANTFRLAIEPVYTVTAVSADGQKEVVLAANVTMPNSAITTAVTISVKLPDGFPTDNLFARHYLSGGGTEILRVTVNGGVASWKQSSFSEVELFADTRGGSIQFNFADGTQETKTYDVADLNTALPTDSKTGATFQGWTIGGATYKTLTEELLGKLGSTALIAEPSFQDDKPSGGNTGTGGGGGGGSSSTVTRYTITVKQTDGGEIEPETVKVKKGEDQTFTITADEGYVIADVLVDGKSVGAVSTYTFEDVTKSHTIQAVFEEKEEETAPAFQFSDVDASGWAAESIYFLYERGIVDGVGDGLFAPTRSITRAEFVKILAGVAGADSETLSGKTTGFTDVEPGSWYAPYVAWAVENGVTSGTSETTFAPNANITREQMATMIYRYAQKVGFALPETQPAVTFDDASTFSAWAADAITAMQRAGIINGVGNNLFAPADNATREQACKMLALLLQLMEE